MLLVAVSWGGDLCKSQLEVYFRAGSPELLDISSQGQSRANSEDTCGTQKVARSPPKGGNQLGIRRLKVEVAEE
jgi:hypothetical protein